MDEDEEDRAARGGILLIGAGFCMAAIVIECGWSAGLFFAGMFFLFIAFFGGR